MRRRPGIQGLHQSQAAMGQYRQLGEAVATARQDLVAAQIATFRSALEEFAARRRADIRRDPVFRSQFALMCAAIGVDPLASNQSAWNRLLGLGDFYSELGVQVVEACRQLRSLDGGMAPLPVVLAAVLRRRGSAADPVSAEDVLRALDRLRVLGGGLQAVRVGAETYVRSVPAALSQDADAALAAAAGRGGRVSLAQLVRDTRWAPARAREALEGLLRQGLALVDDGEVQGAIRDGVRREERPLRGGLADAEAGAETLPAAGRGERLYWIPGLGVDRGIALHKEALAIGEEESLVG